MPEWWETSTWDADGAAPAATDDSKWDGQAGDAQAEAAEPAWGAGGSSWDAAQQDKPPPATDFWETQKWNKDQGILSRKEDWELEQDDAQLFNQGGHAQAGINFQKYEAVPVDISGSKADKIPVCKTFDEIFTKFRSLIPTALEENLKKVEYSTPTPVQKFAVPCGLVGRDIMCCAQTGSGKTASFLIPVIGRMMKHHLTPVGSLDVPFEGACQPDTLVLTPTRELCIQIHEEAQKFCHRTPYHVGRVYGGEKGKIQLEKIAKGVDLVVATPGRFKDFISRGVMSVAEVHVLVLDEADRMLDMGFEGEVREIVENHGMPAKENRQTMMFSATFPEQCQTMAKDFLYDYIWIAVGIVGSAVETVKQELRKVSPTGKFDEFIAILDDFYAARQNKERMLVFVNAKDTAKWLDEQLYEKKFDTGALHGNLEQEERETNLGRFRRGEIDVMVATDVAARGLDIEGVGLVVNYDFPRDSDTYIHRIGRTGRIGNEGRAITFLACDEGGSCLESVDLLKELITVFQNSNADMPEWMAPLIEATEAGSSSSWTWGGTDAREGQEGNTWTGAGDEWWASDQGKAEEATATDTAAQEQPWQKDAGAQEAAWA